MGAIRCGAVGRSDHRDGGISSGPWLISWIGQNDIYSSPD